MSQWPPPGSYPYPPPAYGYPAPYAPPYAPPVPVWQCPFCRSQARPVELTKISTAGWVVFVVLLICCLPLFWIGLLIKQRYRVCSACGASLGNVA